MGLERFALLFAAVLIIDMPDGAAEFYRDELHRFFRRLVVSGVSFILFTFWKGPRGPEFFKKKKWGPLYFFGNPGESGFFRPGAPPPPGGWPRGGGGEKKKGGV